MDAVGDAERLGVAPVRRGESGGTISTVFCHRADHPTLHRETEVRTKPVVGAREPLSSLAGEYAFSSSVHAKVASLSAEYADFRRIRGDGNCFYRAVFYGLAEQVAHATDGVASRAVRDRLQNVRKELLSFGYDDLGACKGRGEVWEQAAKWFVGGSFQMAAQLSRRSAPLACSGGRAHRELGRLV